MVAANNNSIWFVVLKFAHSAEIHYNWSVHKCPQSIHSFLSFITNKCKQRISLEWKNENKNKRDDIHWFLSTITSRRYSCSMKLIYLFLRRSPSNIVTGVTTKFLSNNFLLIFNNFIFFTYWPYGQETIGTLRAVQKWSSACLCLMQWFLLHSWHTNGISPCWWQVFREHLLLFFGFPTTRLLQPLRMCLSTCLLTSSWWDFFIIWLQIGQTGTWTSDKPTVEHLCSSGLRCSKQKISLQWEHWNGKK